MKYISNRNEFLRNHRLKNNKELETNKILEGIGYTYGPDNAGPFSNAIPWGDTLLGRLIHNIIRKARIGAGLVGINREIERLKAEFDRLLDGSVTAKFDEDTKIAYRRITIFSFLDNIERAIVNEEELGIIEGLAIGCISTVKKYKDFENKEELIKMMEDFLKFLENLKEKKSEEKPDISKEFYEKTIFLLNNIIELHKISTIPTREETDDVVKLTKKEDVNAVSKAEELQDKKMGENYFYKNESLPLNENTGTASNVDADNDAKNVLNKIHNSFKTSEFGKMISRIQELIKKAEVGSELEKKWIITIGKQLILNESTVGKPISIDELIKEAEQIATSYNDIPKAISLISKNLLLLKENENLLAKMGNASVPIKNIISAYYKLKELLPSLKGKEVKNESLLNYYKFINEKDEVKIKENTIHHKIKEYWDKMNKEKFMMEKEEVEQLKNQVEKMKNSEMIIIDGIDPIIEIVKCFNRAYKIHTTQVIPTGRTGGRVTNKIYREYTCLGSGGSPDSAGHSGGPYRNNAIFNKWEDAVLDIQKDTKYQKIFRGETILKTEDGKEIKKAGKNLSLFITSLTNGDELYKNSGSGGITGKQADFINKYFECEIPKPSTENDEYDIDTTNNLDTKKVAFKRVSLKYGKYSELKNSFFSITAKNESGETRQIYLYIQDIDNGGIAYISYSRSMGIFQKYIKESGVSLARGVEKGDLPATINLSEKDNHNNLFLIKATKIKLSDLINTDGKLIGGNVEIKYLTKKENMSFNTSILSGEVDKFNILSFFTLVSIDEDEKLERFVADKISGDLIQRIGKGFPNIIRSQGISETYIKHIK